MDKNPFKTSIPDLAPLPEAALRAFLTQSSSNGRETRSHSALSSAKPRHTPLSTLNKSPTLNPNPRSTVTEDEKPLLSDPHKKRRRRNRRVKGCNCKRSKCLKLYCECYAKQVFCGADCKCVECNNVDLPQYEDARSNAIQSSLDRNSSAFFRAPIAIAPLAGLPRKGCKCKRSQCMKNYCECYQAGKGCIDTCRCVDCENEHGVKPPKSKKRKFEPFGTRFTHPSSLPEPTFVKQEPQVPDLELPKQSHENKVLPLTPEKPLPLPPLSSTNPKSQEFSQFISSQLQTVTQQREMYESLLSKHIERLQRKEKILTDMLQTSSFSQAPSISSNTANSEKEKEVQLELRRLYEEFEEAEMERTIERKHSNGSAPSSPGSSTATASEFDSCSDSEYEDEEQLELSGRKWPDTTTDQPLSGSLKQTTTAAPTESSTHTFDNPLIKPALPFGSLLGPKISPIDRVTSDFALPNLPRMNLPIQELNLPISIDRCTSNDLYPSLICRNLSGDAASSVGNWCNNMVMT